MRQEICDNRDVEEPGNLPRVPSGARRSLATALYNATTGVALFDVNLRCTAINAALSWMSGLPGKEYVGRTASQIFGMRGAALENAFELVRNTRRPVRNVPVDVCTGKSIIARVWIADLFPLRDAAGQLSLIGTAFCEEPRKSVRQRNLLDSAEESEVLKLKKRQHARETAEMEEICGPLLKRTFRLISNSMSLRRQMSEMRLAASMAGNSRLDTTRRVLTTSPGHEGHERRLHSLSAREREVVQHLAAGSSNKETAAALSLSTRTVETYRARLMAKLELHSLADLIRYALRHQLIEN